MATLGSRLLSTVISRAQLLPLIAFCGRLSIVANDKLRINRYKHRGRVCIIAPVWGGNVDISNIL